MAVTNSGPKARARGTRVRAEIPISGMTCKACEARVGKLLCKVPGVEQAKVSLARGTATVISARPVATEKLDAALEPAGYRVYATALPLVTSEGAVWRDALIGAAAMAAALWAASKLGLTGLTDQLGGSISGVTTLVLVFVLGLVASVSTCMALVGGLVLSLSARFAKAHPGVSAGRRMRPQLLFNLGRVIGFGALGAGLGALGGVFMLSAHLLAFAMIAVAVVMGLIGLRLTGLAPRLSRVSITLPASWTRLWDRAEESGGYQDWTALALGAASFFLPCGFTQAVQVYALSTGSAAQAGLIMAVFALGTTPGLLGAGALGALAKGQAARRVFRFIGVAVCAFALVNLVGAVQVLRPDLFAVTAGEAATIRSDNVVDEGEVQVVRTVQNGTGYSPRVSTVYVNRPVRWEVDRQALGCASTMNLSAMGLGMVSLEDGINRFEFTPTEVGTLAYTCGMGMFPAQIDVIEAPSGGADAQLDEGTEQ